MSRITRSLSLPNERTKMSNAGTRASAQRVQDRKEPEEEAGAMGCLAYIMQAGSILLFILFFPLSLVFSLKVLQEYQRGVVFRLGRIVSGDKGKGPGVIFVLPCIDDVRIFDLRTHSRDIKPQQILTRDSVSITVDAVVFSRLLKLTRSVMCISDPHNAARLHAATVLRKFVGQKTLLELLSDRRQLSVHMQKALDRRTKSWGMKIEKVDMKSITLPNDMKRSMAAEAETDRKAKAKVIAADGEMKAAHALKEAADIISQSPAGLQLRCLETMRTISKKNNNTVVFPVPQSILDAFLRR